MNEKFFDVMVKELSSQIHHGGNLLKDFPKTLKIVMGSNQWNQPMWRERVDKDTGKLITFDRFEDFVATPPTAGLGASMDMLWKICQDDLQAIDMLDREVQRSKGGDTSKGTNRALGDLAPSTESRQGTLRALRKNAPELHEKVISGEMTPARAAMAAGIRKSRISIRRDDPASAARTIVNNATSEFISELVNLLNQQRKGT